MRIWLPLLVAPLLALADQSVSYTTVVWACPHQDSLAVHWVHVPFLLAAAACTVVAWQRWRDTSPMKMASEMLARRHFFAGLAIGSAALSALVILVMFSATWALHSCVY
jgi:hypothetical protein